MKKIAFLLMLLVQINFCQASLLGGIGNLCNKIIISGDCTFLDPDSHNETAKGDITMFTEDGNLWFQVSSNDSNYEFVIEFPLRYMSVNTSDHSTPRGYEYTLYEMSYGNTKIAFINNHNIASFVVKYKGKLYNIESTPKFYDRNWDVIKKKNGTTVRDGDAVENWFADLFAANFQGKTVVS